MELVEGGELFDHIVQMGAFTEPVARYVPWPQVFCSFEDLQVDGGNSRFQHSSFLFSIDVRIWCAESTKAPWCNSSVTPFGTQVFIQIAEGLKYIHSQDGWKKGVMKV